RPRRWPAAPRTCPPCSATSPCSAFRTCSWSGWVRGSPLPSTRPVPWCSTAPVRCRSCDPRSGPAPDTTTPLPEPEAAADEPSAGTDRRLPREPAGPAGVLRKGGGRRFRGGRRTTRLRAQAAQRVRGGVQLQREPLQLRLAVLRRLHRILLHADRRQHL